ncbi:hypothetical protein GQ55_5G320800 [Panicum hallii var. hallii]|uniref:Uncharacterized protein n=1 Tax=Panicum hallii var. hallii TaxID=1504633 RepID=A0A2T7DLR2_9POAL|nr:hypothetical protein GQ55_5G320800 [Panicum hallii var. hallii]
MNPLQDITNVDVIGSQHTPKSPPSSRSRDKQRDVILLQDDVEFVPDSFSPQLRPGDRRVVVEKESPPRVTPKLSKKREASTSSRNVTFSSISKVLDLSESHEVEVLGQTSFSQSVRDMTRSCISPFSSVSTGLCLLLTLRITNLSS